MYLQPARYCYQYVCLHVLSRPLLFGISKRLENKLKSSNIKHLFDVKDIPLDTQLRTVLDNIPTDSFSDVFTNMFEQLRRHHPETI
jgi:chromatin remodeling complex protein RSC6